MKEEEIEKAAVDHGEKVYKGDFHPNYNEDFKMKVSLDAYNDFKEGAEWMYSQYGVSPETVKEMLEALREVYKELQFHGWHNTRTGFQVKEITEQAEQELNTK